MSEPIHAERPAPESPLLWPALVLFVIAAAAYTWYWDNHRHVFHAKSNDAMEQVETSPKAKNK